jgi:uncharacterized membrane protein YgaE (UPF0421/DUF939 family)
LIHWPILFGPSAALFLLLNGMVGIELARLCAIVVGICLAFAGSLVFLGVDRRALELSRTLRGRMSDAIHEMPRERAPRADRIVPAE